MAQTTDVFTAYHDQLMAECRDMIRKEMAASFGKIIERAPVVQVAAPHVALSPAITVDAPVTLESPEVEVTVDMAALAAEMASVRALLGQILTTLSAPVTKTVHRDGQWISSVTETRG